MPELTKNDAAKIIQKAWQSHVDKRVFKFYKDLIGFHTKMMSDHLSKNRKARGHGANNGHGHSPTSEKLIEKSSLVTATSKQCAATILRLISPKEAQLMDDAAGTHIRFRLASPKKSEDCSADAFSKFGNFPPAVYYKIYTHRPIVDLCATAPRNYTLPANKVTLPKQQFNFQPANKQQEGPIGYRLPSSYNQDPTSNWYQRHENNEWRAISDSQLLSSIRVISDVKTSASKSKEKFKPTITQRRLKRHNDQKRKRIDWLAKIYFQNRGNAGTMGEMDLDEEDVLADAVEDIFVISKQHEASEDNPWSYCHDIDDEIADADIQALIEWTDCLDYDDYTNYWSHLGTAGFPSVDILGVKKSTKIRNSLLAASGGLASQAGGALGVALQNKVIHEHSRIEIDQTGFMESVNDSTMDSTDRSGVTGRSISAARSQNTPRTEANPKSKNEENTNHVNFTNSPQESSFENSDFKSKDMDDYWTLDKLEQMSRPVSGRIAVRK